MFKCVGSSRDPARRNRFSSWVSPTGPACATTGPVADLALLGLEELTCSCAHPSTPSLLSEQNRVPYRCGYGRNGNSPQCELSPRDESIFVDWAGAEADKVRLSFRIKEGSISCLHNFPLFSSYFAFKSVLGNGCINLWHCPRRILNLAPLR